jgi:hypothetical protein
MCGVVPAGQGVLVTSPQASRRGAFVAPALLFVALLGGAMFFGLLAMSSKYEKDVAADHAAATGAPSKPVPAAKTVATTRPARSPHATTTPPAMSGAEQKSPTVTPQSADALNQANDVASLPRKPVPGRTAWPILGGYCTPAGSTGHTANGDEVVCGSSPKAKDKGQGENEDERNRWQIS